MTSLYEPPNNNYYRLNIKILEYLSENENSYVNKLAKDLGEETCQVRYGVGILESLRLVDVRMKGSPRLIEITEKGRGELALLRLL